MKTILACTDFSPAARNASSYAAQLAKLLDARLILMTAYQPDPVVVTETPLIVSAEELQEVTEKQLKSEVSRLHVGPNLKVAICSREGFASGAILEAAEEWDADLIVTGMKATGKKIRRVFGSTVTGLARKTKIPMMVVPENALYEHPGKIALAYESDASLEADPAVLGALKEIAERFLSSLFLVHVSKNIYKEAFSVLNKPFRLQRMLYAFKPEVKQLHGKDLGEVLNEFVKDNHINMLALLPQKHSLLENFFMHGATRQLVFESAVPVLILPGMKED